MATATGASRLRELMVDSPASVGARRRAQRWELFARLFPDLDQMSVLDLGGTAEAWHRAPVHPASVVVLNLLEPGETTEPWLRPVLGDACTARRSLAAAEAPAAYDLVFSNSLIEHVGGHAQRAALAREVHALAPRHWVQTPNRYFPVEPHWLCPGLQFLPVGARARVAAAWPLAHTRPDSREDALAEVQWTELIGRAEMRAYFPGSEIHQERMAGLTKSLIAVAAAA
ncbi:methyltransferase type 11 [Nocardioides sp. zg-DK7169]|uniref:methyltransferase type 11 n=1 Tax=Nocardioides sp. zg-DK7169 TaxID=2736600 RepID=UPI0015564CAC|nr:methyltransferase type 11 [Nocardioides sp. zg-DK7169]NPC97929.1 methyltransferase type 11 [Nocardioides sp. zg-DK7169]